jgi:hypothetical protein
MWTEPYRPQRKSKDEFLALLTLRTVSKHFVRLIRSFTAQVSLQNAKASLAGKNEKGLPLLFPDE